MSTAYAAREVSTAVSMLVGMLVLNLTILTRARARARARTRARTRALARARTGARLTGRVYLERNNLNLYSNILDCPDFFWEAETFEPLYRRVNTYLDIEDRVRILNNRRGIEHGLVETLSGRTLAQTLAHILNQILNQIRTLTLSGSRTTG